jgi:hypothetical protein
MDGLPLQRTPIHNNPPSDTCTHTHISDPTRNRRALIEEHYQAHWPFTNSVRSTQHTHNYLPTASQFLDTFPRQLLTKHQLPPSTPVQEPQQLKSASTQTLTTQAIEPTAFHPLDRVRTRRRREGYSVSSGRFQTHQRPEIPPSTSAPLQPEQRPAKLRRNSSTRNVLRNLRL